MSRVEENPLTTTCTPPEMFVKTTLEMKGTLGLVVMVEIPVAALEAVAVSVMVPATVPVITLTLVDPGNVAVVDPEAMVKLTVRLPVEN